MPTWLIKFGLPVVSVAVVVLGAYWYGYSEAQEAAEIERAELIDEQTEKRNRYEEELAKSQATLVKLSNQVKAKQKTIVKEVVEYVQSPAINVCEFDPEWMSIRQRILQTANTRPSTNE